MTLHFRNNDQARHGFRARLLSGLAISATALMNFSPAHAQTMDYGSLEKLFGEAVTASATGSPQRATEVPANMTIITANEILRSGARDIPGVLRHVGGVDVMQWTNDQADVAIRGNDQVYAARTLVLIDGRQVYADFYGYIPWNTLPVELSAIRQIEIVKGPNSALFGFNAVDGVINIITYNPRYDDVNTVSASAGTQGMAGLSGVATVRFGTIGAVRLSAGLSSENEFNTIIPQAMADTRRAEISRAKLNANAVFVLDNNVELDFDASHSHARRNEIGPTYFYINNTSETDSLLVRLSADTDAGLLKFTAYNNWISSRLIETAEFGQFAFHNRVTVVQGEDSFGLGTDHIVRLALEYRYNTVNTAPVTGGDIFYDVVAASAMWSWAITPSVSVSNAVRIDHLSLGRSGAAPLGYPFTNKDWDRKLDAISYNSGLVWRLGAQDTIRVTASRGVQLPSLSNSGAFLVSTPVVGMTGVPSIKPTTVTDYQVNWDRELPEISARLRAGLFYQRSDNVASIFADFIVTPSSFYVTSGTVGHSQTKGLELNLDSRIGNEWRWSVNYRAELVDDQFVPHAMNGTSFVDCEHATPKHQAKASLGWQRGDWEVDTYLGYQSGTSGLRTTLLGNTELVPIGSYVSVDGRVAYRLTDWATLSVSGQNLLQSPQRQTSGAAVERQVFATLSASF